MKTIELIMLGMRAGELHLLWLKPFLQLQVKTLKFSIFLFFEIISTTFFGHDFL